MTIQDWEKEFSQSCDEGHMRSYEEIKSFIRSAISAAVEEKVKEIRKEINKEIDKIPNIMVGATLAHVLSLPSLNSKKK